MTSIILKKNDLSTTTYFVVDQNGSVQTVRCRKPIQNTLTAGGQEMRMWPLAVHSNGRKCLARQINNTVRRIIVVDHDLFHICFRPRLSIDWTIWIKISKTVEVSACTKCVKQATSVGGALLSTNVYSFFGCFRWSTVDPSLFFFVFSYLSIIQCL